MSVAAPHYAKFYEEVAESRAVWAIRDAGGYPAPLAIDGKRAMPFWSSQSRAQKVISNVKAYAGFEAVQIPLDEFLERWVPGLSKDNLLMGINWAGQSATGYDVGPEEFMRNIQGIV